MIDLHVHLLPSVDDGPADLDQALAMARRALADGTHSAATTPHHLNGHHTNEAASIRRAVRTFRRALAEAGIALKIHPGSEIHLVPELPHALAAGTAMTIADRGCAVLVELPARHLPVGAESILQACLAQGVTPLIAHAERNRVLAERPEILAHWVDMGCRGQATAGSYAGRFGPSAQRAAWRLTERGLVHIVASDGHRVRGRAPSMAAGRAALAERLGDAIAVLLTETYPQALLEGRALDPAPLRAALANRLPAHGRWWQRLIQERAGR